MITQPSPNHLEPLRRTGIGGAVEEETAEKFSTVHRHRVGQPAVADGSLELHGVTTNCVGQERQPLRRPVRSVHRSPDAGGARARIGGASPRARASSISARTSRAASRGGSGIRAGCRQVGEQRKTLRPAKKRLDACSIVVDEIDGSQQSHFDHATHTLGRVEIPQPACVNIDARRAAGSRVTFARLEPAVVQPRIDVRAQ